jgi:hypothetical protein
MMIRVGGACGYWGDSAHATPQLIAGGAEALVYDYLAEITMSLLARARMKDPEDGGYARDFVTEAMVPNLAEIAERGIKVVSNAGGVNPAACAKALRRAAERDGLSLRIAVVEGDDLIGRKEELAASVPAEMFSQKIFPPAETVVSINAYLGAAPIKAALDARADIVVTGRCVDSALTLGLLMHRFGWSTEDYDLLAAGSLVGHLLECGAQATGGNFTDWEEVPGRADIGYPIAEVEADGSATITKPEGTGGLVSRATVGEQLLYEIGDPADYRLPDVRCDFTDVRLSDAGEDRVRVEGAKGRPPTRELKVCATYLAGWRGGLMLTFYGFDATRKARAFAKDVEARAGAKLVAGGLPPFSELSEEVLGSRAHFGESADTDEVVLKLAARHPQAEGIAALLKEAAGLGLAAPPGLCGFAGTRPKPSPVVELFSFLLDRNEVSVSYELQGEQMPVPLADGVDGDDSAGRSSPPVPDLKEDMAEVALIEVAWARSGDKGNDANVGVIARDMDFLPYLWAQLTEEAVADRFAHVLEGDVERYFLPGPGAINFVLRKSLGGGGIASLRNDPQGKGFGQLLLTMPVQVPTRLLGRGA